MNNTVELIGWYGGDEINACSAWTSTSRELTEEKRGRIGKLLKDLATNGHETPFEKTVLHFLVTTDIATHIHLLKHRIASINAESARYKELKEDRNYIPPDWPTYWKDKLIQHNREGDRLYHQCLTDLTIGGMDRKRAKESARYFKSYNSQIQADIMFNFRSFVNFQRLRNSSHAQVEIREIAQEMVELIKSIDGNPLKYTIEAFGL
jgi:thymidylate synthase (FAD)